MSVELCVNLTGELAREVNVQLFTFSPGNGFGSGSGFIVPTPGSGSIDPDFESIISAILNGTIDLATPDSDYQSLFVVLTFVEGGSICHNVSLVQDLLLEREELFIALVESGDLSVNIGTPSVTVAFLSDSNSKFWHDVNDTIIYI